MNHTLTVPGRSLASRMKPRTDPSARVRTREGLPSPEHWADGDPGHARRVRLLIPEHPARPLWISPGKHMRLTSHEHRRSTAASGKWTRDE
jgi:hypothetical protein